MDPKTILCILMFKSIRYDSCLAAIIWAVGTLCMVAKGALRRAFVIGIATVVAIPWPARHLELGPYESLSTKLPPTCGAVWSSKGSPGICAPSGRASL